MKTADKLFLLDAYALIYRAYYALIKNPRINSKGQNTSAIMGFVNTLEEVLKKENPTHIGIAFDPAGPTFRHEAYPAYKAQREETPEDIRKSVPIIKEIIKAYNIPILEVMGFEADDVIGTLATKAGEKGIDTYMLTPDKDYGQLVKEHIYMYRPKFTGGFEIMGPEEVKATITDIVSDGLDIMMKMEAPNDDKEYLKNLTLTAVRLAQSDIPDADAIRQLGEGWTAEEAWAISLYCAIRHIDNMRVAIIAAVNHDGDSDSTGAITGNLMGAIYGYEAIKGERMFCPEGREFENTIELANIILAFADDLFTGCLISEYDPIETPEKKQWYERYCEMKPVGL